MPTEQIIGIVFLAVVLGGAYAFWKIK